MSKKIVAMLMAVAMAFSLLPVTAFATGGPQERNSQTPVTVKKSENNLTMTKTVTPKGNGTYTVQLESYATGSVTPTQAPVPMDFVLVLDVSGSMDGENGKIASYGYQETKKTSWSAKDFYLTGTTYYTKSGEEYYPVSCQRKSVPNQYIGSHYEYWLEANGQSLGNTGKWSEQLYSGSLYIYDKVPDSEMSKLAAMKTAVNNFIESVAAQKNGNTPVAHRISIVKFAGDRSDKVGNDTYTDDENIYNYTQKVRELTDVTDEGSVDSLKDAVNALTAGGATAADWGMKKAEDVLTKRENKKNPSIVIMFTDGEPNHHSDYDKAVAGAAVDTAKTLKNSGTKVYTIGMFTDADPSDTRGAFNKYMNGVSSKYPDAFGTKNNKGKYTGIDLGTPAGGNYYFKADNAGDLDQVFQTISQSTTVTSPLDASAVVVDNVPSNFALNEGSVQVYTADCTGKNSKGELTWKDTLEKSNIIPNIPEDKNEDGSQTISTTGFNFSGNWCGLDSNNEATGKKLIIEFTIKCTNYGGTQPTNAGAYIKAGKEANEEPIISLKDPQVPVTISLGSNEELLDKLKVEEEQTYNGSGFAILSEVAKKVNALVNGTNIAKNDYVNMELTVTVEGTTYTYKIRAGKQTGSWYQGDQKMDPNDVSRVKTSQNVNRGENNAYTYKFDLTLSDAAPNGAADPAEYKGNNASFKITPKDVTVKANDQRVEKGTAPDSITYTATVTGLVNGEQESLISRDIKCNTYTVDTPVTAVGSELEITATGAKEQGNYTVTYRPGKLTVVEAPVTTGILKVTKEVQGENLTLDKLPSDFKITVTGTGESKELSLKDSGVNVNESKTEATWTIPGLDPGEYTVSESNADVTGYDCKATYSATNGATVIVNSSDASTVQNQPTTDAQASQKVTVTAGSESTMTVTNTYTKNQGPVTPTEKWDVSKSKTATKLDSNYESKVKLSIPSSEEQLVSDVVFVLDKSTSANLESQALAMLSNLKNQIKKTGAKVNVGVVIFNKVANIANDGKFFDLATEYNNIENAIKQEINSGTNTHAGLLAGKDMLDADKTVDSNRKYLVFVSDGITYMYNKEPTVTAWTFRGDAWNTWAGPDNWASKYGSTEAPSDWNVWIQNIALKVTEQGTSYEYPYEGTVSQATPQENWNTAYANSTDKALYLTYQVYQDIVKAGYHCYAMTAESTSAQTYPWGTSFMSYLSDGTEVTFDSIQNDILYTVSAGSRVEDYMGYVEGDYNFDFINDASKLSITVGTGENKETLEAAVIGENHYGFGPVKKVQEPEAVQEMTTSETSYRYELEYVPSEKKNDEHFIWRINVPVSNFAPVALTYSVKLMNPKSASGTYGQYDENGSKNYSGLYTNNSATLYPVDSNSKPGVPENFLKPTVSYTVKGSSGSHSGGSRPSLNTKDHYGYIIGYPVDYYTGQPTTDQTKKPVRPEGKITRAEVATIYFRMLTDESRTKFWSQNSGYSDVKTGDWFNNAVSTLSNAGIIAGYEDGSFRPNGYITRAEFATIAARFFDVTYNGKDLFPDISGHWAKDYINQAANKGFVNGYEDGTFKPDRNITRAEAVTLVNRTLDRHPDKNHFTKDMLVWPDNMDQTKWYYADMQEATNSHTYQMKENSDKTKYENWTKTLPIRNWEALEKAWSNANSSQGNGNVV